LNSEYSFDKAESNYLRCLEIIRRAPEMRSEIIDLLKSLFDTRAISSEPVAYLMHVLRWPEMRDWAEVKLSQLPNAIATGAPLEKMIEAFSDDWENREFYKLFSTK